MAAVNMATAAALPPQPRKKQKRTRKQQHVPADFINQVDVKEKATVYHAYLQSIGKESVRVVPTVLKSNCCRHCGYTYETELMGDTCEIV